MTGPSRHLVAPDRDGAGADRGGRSCGLDCPPPAAAGCVETSFTRSRSTVGSISSSPCQSPAILRCHPARHRSQRVADSASPASQLSDPLAGPDRLPIRIRCASHPGDHAVNQLIERHPPKPTGYLMNQPRGGRHLRRRPPQDERTRLERGRVRPSKHRGGETRLVLTVRRCVMNFFTYIEAQPRTLDLA